MLAHYPAIAALAEQRQADLRHDAEQVRLARSSARPPTPSVARRLPLVAVGTASSRRLSDRRRGRPDHVGGVLR
jgi:hypothetical protein